MIMIKSCSGGKKMEKRVRVLHEPLLLFLSLWHCRDVRIYWDFSLGQAMTAEGPHKQRDTKGERGRGKRPWAVMQQVVIKPHRAVVRLNKSTVKGLLWKQHSSQMRSLRSHGWIRRPVRDKREGLRKRSTHSRLLETSKALRTYIHPYGLWIR